MSSQRTSNSCLSYFGTRLLTQLKDMRCRKKWLWLWQLDYLRYSQELLTLAWRDCYNLPDTNKTISLNYSLLLVFLSSLPQNFTTLLMRNLVISTFVYSWTTCIFCPRTNDIAGHAQFFCLTNFCFLVYIAQKGSSFW